MHEPQLGQIKIGGVNQYGKRKHLFELFSGWSRRLDLLISTTAWGTIPIHKATESKLVTTNVPGYPAFRLKKVRLVSLRVAK
jgi:hypothetical protein